MTFSSYQSEKLFRCPYHLLPLLQKFHLALVEITKAWQSSSYNSGKDSSHFSEVQLLGIKRCTYLVHAGNDEEKSGSDGSSFLNTAKTENDSSFVFLKNRSMYRNASSSKNMGNNNITKTSKFCPSAKSNRFNASSKLVSSTSAIWWKVQTSRNIPDILASSRVFTYLISPIFRMTLEYFKFTDAKMNHK